MIIKKFEEYKFDYEDDITEEYAKFIISKTIDERDKSLEDIFYEVGKSDELEEQQDSVQTSIIIYLEKLLKDAKNLRTIEEIEASKYNL